MKSLASGRQSFFFNHPIYKHPNRKPVSKKMNARRTGHKRSPLRKKNRG